MMVFKSAKSAIRHLTHRRFKSAEDYFRKRTRFGEINEFFKYQIISTDSEFYTLPFLANPFRAAKEKASWPDRQDLSYEYPDDEPAKQGSGTRRSEALGHFAIAYDLVKDRVGADAVILDVGCNTGFFLEQFHNKGFTNLHGIEPQAKAVEYARRTRPYLMIKEGFFGPRQNDLPCDLLIFFQTITRVPYQERLFDAIARSARKYVLVS
ncbi:MAG: class I SAM-dependent methyltransferase [Rhodospirillales bacterium]|nr:class I SAM-dependent methyltransferase [Rhodospirillales bacterium]